MENDKTLLIEFLSKNSKLNAEELAHSTAYFTNKNLRKNDFLLREGKISNEYIFLQSGLVRTFATDLDGNEVTTGFISENQIVLEVASFFLRIPTAENIQAITDCKYWSISFDDFQTLFHSIPAFREFGRSRLINGYVSLKQRTLSMITEKAEKRYEHLVKTRPEIAKTVSLKYIASYLGITDTSLSRIRKELAGK